MTDSELMGRSSIQVFIAKPDEPKPVGFGSACIIRYLDRNFLLRYLRYRFNIPGDEYALR
jgi:hypothetical protein